MILQQEFLNKLKDFGLNTYEARIWSALLSRGISTAGELSDISNVPRSRSYDVLESLEKKGFVIVRVGKPIKYLAVPPEEAIERVKRKLNKEAEERAALLEELKSTKLFTELNFLHDKGVELVEPGDLTGSFKDRDNIYNHVETMFKRAKKSITILTSEKGILRKEERFKRVLKKVSQRGVKIRIAAPLTKDTKSKITKLNQISEIRDSKYMGRLILIDDKEVMFMLMDDSAVHPSYDVAVWVNSPFFSGLFTKLFEEQYTKMPVMK